MSSRPCPVPTLAALIVAATLKAARRGDVALDDGTNTRSRKPALAVFDGTQWPYMN